MVSISVMEIQYVYLIQEREFIQSKQNVFKIGKTKQPNFKRFTQYSKGSNILFQSSCSNCDTCEMDIIRLFKTIYKQRKDFGNEYFEGKCDDMILDIMKVVALSYHCIKQERNCSETQTEIDLVKETATLSATINKYDCSFCNFSTVSNSKLMMHFSSQKHIQNVQSPGLKLNKFQCVNCKKHYKGPSGLWAHKKKCVIQNATNIHEPNVYMEIMEEMKEMNKQTNLRLDKISQIITKSIKN
jgi:hypothetical protein